MKTVVVVGMAVVVVTLEGERKKKISPVLASLILLQLPQCTYALLRTISILNR